MNIEERTHQRGERLRELAQTGPGTAMGKLLRRFWHPVAISKELPAGEARPLRVFCEDLTLYRSEAGNVHLVGGRCAHRLTLLHTGWIEGEEIRCMYHGWRYDGTGQCTLRPAERDNGLPNVKIAGYPVREYAGFIFAFLGIGAAPPFDLPRKACFERDGGFHVIRRQVWPCNWLQLVENSLDAVHVSFVHARGHQGRFVQSVSQNIPDLEYFETDAGIRQIATRSSDNVRVSDWTFPNNNHIVVPGPIKGGPWVDTGIWNVPIDDTHTQRMNIYSMPSQGKEIDKRLLADWDAHQDYNPANHHDALFYQNAYPPDEHSDLTNAQDYVAQVGQGTIVDREHEMLGRSDAGIALLRRIFFRELDAQQSGQNSKDWTPLAKAVELPRQHASGHV